MSIRAVFFISLDIVVRVITIGSSVLIQGFILLSFGYDLLTEIV